MGSSSKRCLPEVKVRCVLAGRHRSRAIWSTLSARRVDLRGFTRSVTRMYLGVPVCGGLGQPRGICNSRAHLFLCRFSRCNAASIAPLRVLLSRPPTPEKKCASPLAARSPARSPPPPLAPGLGSAIITCARGFPWLVAETCPSLHGGDPCLLPCILLIARPGHLWLQSGDVLCQSVRSSRIAALAPVCSLA